jgi:hypothetical protein
MSAFQMVVLVLPAAGLAYSTGRIGHRAGRFGWRWSDGSPRRRTALLAGTAALAALATFLLWPNGDYRPIQPYERGTLMGAVRQVDDVSSGRPSLTIEREHELGGAPTERQLRREGRERPLRLRYPEGTELPPGTTFDGTEPLPDEGSGSEPAPGTESTQPSPTPDEQTTAPEQQPAPAPTDTAPTTTDTTTATDPTTTDSTTAPTDTTPTDTTPTDTTPTTTTTP